MITNAPSNAVSEMVGASVGSTDVGASVGVF